MFDFSVKLVEGAGVLDVELGEDDVERLRLYFVELKKWGRRMNLVAKRCTDLQLVENHFLDSLALLPLLTGGGVHLLDVGCGAGFPGLVCKVVKPAMRVTLVEPRLKRVSFLRHMVRVLNLAHVRVEACRVEDDVLQEYDNFSHITCRALTDTATFLGMVKRFFPSRAGVICMKGPRWRGEFAETELQSFVLREVKNYSLPFSGAKRSLLLFDYV